MKKKIYPLLTLCMLLFVFAMSQTPQSKPPKPVYGKAGIKKKFSELKNTPMAAKLRKTPYDTPAIKPIRTFLKKRYKDFVRTFKINSVGTPLQQREGDNGLAKALPAISSAAAISAAGST